MATKAEIRLAGAARIRFRSPAEFQSWVEAVDDAWLWMQPVHASRPRLVQNGRNYLQQFLAEAKKVAQAADSAAIASFSENLNVDYPLGVPFDPANPIVASLRETFARVSPAAEQQAIGAYLAVERRQDAIEASELNHPIIMQALGLVGAHRDKRGLGVRSAALQTVAQSEERVNRLLAEAEERLAAEIEAAQESIRHLTEEAKSVAGTLSEQAAESVARINKTRDDYEEVMQTKAPIDYWDGKAREHQGKVDVYRAVLGKMTAGFVLLLCIVYLAGWFALDHILDKQPQNGVALSLYVAGFVGAITAVSLWYIRIVVRLYMSQHHLAGDAAERASLLRTYLALTLTSDASKEERALVLASVFRPISDGIVKDDGAPNFSPATMLGNLLDPAKKA